MRHRILIIAPFFSTEFLSRPFFAAKVLGSIATADVLTSNFDHHKKTKRENLHIEEIRKISYVPTLSYSKNVSLKRFISHALFSLRSGLYFRKFGNDYDAVYVTTPFNLSALLVLLQAGDKKKILDVIDIWPDSLPFPPKIKKAFRPFFSIWKQSFQKAVKRADFLMTVSDEFLRESLRYFHKEAGCAKRIYIGHDFLACQPFREKGFITIAYVGNLGNLCDLGILINVLETKEFLGKYRLHIIGDGDIRSRLIEQLQQKNIPYNYFGIIYDKDRLGKILGEADLGFNGYKSTNASFSYKANTYMAANLPIINSMPGDLHNLVDEKRIGLNYVSGDADSLGEVLRSVNPELLIHLKENCKKYFYENLASERIEEEMRSFFTEKVGLGQPVRHGRACPQNGRSSGCGER